MPFIEYDPAMCRKSDDKEFYSGYLLKAGIAAIERKPFGYSIVKDRSFSVAMAGIPKQYAIPSETIRTTRLDLPFNTNDKVVLQDGRTMTVSDIAYDSDDDKALASGDGRTAWIITLQGGGT